MLFQMNRAHYTPINMSVTKSISMHLVTFSFDGDIMVVVVIVVVVFDVVVVLRPVNFLRLCG